MSLHMKDYKKILVDANFSEIGQIELA